MVVDGGELDSPLIVKFGLLAESKLKGRAGGRDKLIIIEELNLLIQRYDEHLRPLYLLEALLLLQPTDK